MQFPATAGNEQLTIAALDFICPAWWATDLSPLWTRAKADGPDVPIPGGETIARRKSLPPWRVVVPMAIGGAVDPEGDPHAFGDVGLEENIDAINAAIDVLTTGDGTRALVLTRASGATWGNPCHVLGLDLGTMNADGTANAALELSIPAGRLVPVGGS